MNFTLTIIVLSIMLTNQLDANKYAENFDDASLWKYLYSKDYKVNMHNVTLHQAYDPSELEAHITERNYDIIFNYISEIQTQPRTCFPDFQSILQEHGKDYKDKDFYMVGEGKSGSVYYFKGYAIKVLEEVSIGENAKIERLAHKENNLKYNIRELNTGNLILTSYMKENNILSNMNFVFSSCVEKSLKNRLRTENEITYKIFILMPFFPLSLREVIDGTNTMFELPSLLLDWKLKILDGTILGIYWIHSNGYAHRDLKPSNIMLSKEGIPMISDFGFAKEFSLGTESIVGSPLYMAPEIKVEFPNYTHKVDVYSLGVIIFEILNLHSRINIRTMNRTSIINYCDEIAFPYFSVERNIKEVYCNYFHTLVTNMLEVHPDNRPDMNRVIRGWIQFRLNAEQMNKKYEQELFNIGSSLSESGLQNNFLVERQTEPMDYQIIPQSVPFVPNTDQIMSEQSVNVPKTEITLLTITTEDPMFSSKCHQLFDIIKTRFESQNGLQNHPQYLLI